MIKLVHGADLHLDAPFAGLPPEQAAQLRQEQRELPLRLARLCQREKADLLLLCGDIFDGPRVYRQTLDQLHRAFAQCGAAVLIAPGNHDPMTEQSVWNTEEWEPNVHIFTEQTIRSVFLPELNCRVYGAAFTAMDCPPLLEGFRAPGEELQLMVLHGDGEKPRSNYNPITREQIGQSGLDYLALGHVHSFSGLRRMGKTAYAWPGCPQGRGFDECGEKGVIVAEVSKTDTRLRFEPLCSRRYQSLELRGENWDTERILAELPVLCREDCYQITLTGACDVSMEQLQAALEGRCFALRLIDRTTLPEDVWADCGQDSLRGLFLQSIRQELDETEDSREKRVLEQAAKLGIRLMDGWEVNP